ncbi:hypothetical protein RvY_17520-2 [Ramazzottius varieornatus]|nr:hypothetical protein RvY_17520-2 [Ramazzottius varieornatus]
MEDGRENGDVATQPAENEKDSLVRQVIPYVEKPLWLHGYMTFFLPIYGFWAYTSLMTDLLAVEMAMILLAGIGVLQILVVLSCIWSVAIRCALTCTQVDNPKMATVVQVIPLPNNGSAELVRLNRFHADPSAEHPSEAVIVWFLFQKVKFVYNEINGDFKRPPFPVNLPFHTYKASKGHADETAKIYERTFGRNRLEMYAPNFRELFTERATAPFFVFQVFCVGLWCLDEYWYYSVFTLFMLVAFEATLVQQQLRNLSEIRKMGYKPYNLQVYRNRRWRQISTEELVPGDVISIIRRPEEDRPVPADMVLLRGTCIVDESLLTGESVPQMKESIESMEDYRRLNMNEHGRLHVLFGGTRVVQHSAPDKSTDKDLASLRPPDNGCLCYVLTTGFNTSQGSLLRTIMFGVKRVTANNLETFGFILFLLVFAISAAAYLWIEGSKDEKRNKYKLFLECSLILTSVVPPELPIELSLAVNSSLLALVKLGTFCTEPFRIPFAGKIDMCCFDKTGTLTSDVPLVQGIAGIAADQDSQDGSPPKSHPYDLISVDVVPAETTQVLAACHSLALLDDTTIGDPLEKVTLEAIKWNVTKADAVVPLRGKQSAIKIHQRFHFSSALKRMSVVAGTSQSGRSDAEYFGAVKGAPETLRSMFARRPDKYDDICLHHTRSGARVLALGRKSMGNMSSSALRSLRRDDVECDLDFVGFLIISTPLRPESQAVVQELLQASHHITMITGDNALTACHVASELAFCQEKSSLIFEPAQNGWESVHGRQLLPFETVLEKGRATDDLCLTGPGLDFIQANYDRSLVRSVLPKVKVFARFTPTQKEWLINELKHLGFVTLMVGDGTNDVGALKHAHVGVALLQKSVVSVEKLKASMADSSGGGTLVPLQMPLDPVQQKEKDLRKKKAIATLPTPPPPGPGRRPAAQRSSAQDRQAKLQQMVQEMQDEQEVTVVKLGDASVAAPFSSKIGSVRSVCDIIKQGRCTLVTTLQMFKILALNALILAYSQSVLYLKGVKFSDTQATLQGLFLAACFLFISRSKPLTVLSSQRPLANIFNVYTLVTVVCQFAIHFGCLVYLVTTTLSKYYSLPAELDLEAEFAPNLLNTVVYLMSMTLQVSTFLVNYRGRPFMVSLLENRPLVYSIVISLTGLFALASNTMPSEIRDQFQIVAIPDEFVPGVVGALALDIFAAWFVDRILMLLCGEGKLKQR